MNRRRDPHIAWPVKALATFAVGGALFAAYQESTLGGDGLGASTTTLVRSGSRRVVSGTSLSLSEGPSEYTITYRNRSPGARDTVETLEVSRPYRSRTSSPTQVRQTDFARISLNPGSSQATVLNPPPGPIDPRPWLVVDRAVAEGLLERREQRSVAGERCQVYRGFDGVAASTISAALPGSHVDVCVSKDGLVLEEWQIRGGRANRQRIATRIERQDPLLPPIDDAPPLPAAQGGGSVLAVDPLSEPPGRFFVLEAPPPGFELRGRYSVVPPQAGLADPAERRRAVASTADVFERGIDVVVVDRGGTLNLERAIQSRPEGRSVDLGPVLGPGELLLSWSGPEVRWGDADGKFIRVFGTIGVDEVLALARSLRETDGGPGLVFLEPAPSNG